MLSKHQSNECLWEMDVLGYVIPKVPADDDHNKDDKAKVWVINSTLQARKWRLRKAGVPSAGALQD